LDQWLAFGLFCSFSFGDGIVCQQNQAIVYHQLIQGSIGLGDVFLKLADDGTFLPGQTSPSVSVRAIHSETASLASGG